MNEGRNMRPQPPAPAKRFLTSKEGTLELRISLAMLDRVIKRGDLRAKKHGHSTLVMESEIARYIEAWPDAPASPPKELGRSALAG